MEEWRNHPKFDSRKEAQEAGYVIHEMNRQGSKIGLCTCGICGDSILWKNFKTLNYSTLNYSKSSGAFPYCVECDKHASKSLKETAIDNLMRIWSQYTDPNELEQTRKALKSLL